LDGLECDARIAISSQFSILDRSIFFGSEAESSASSENREAKALGSHNTANEATTAENEEAEDKTESLGTEITGSTSSDSASIVEQGSPPSKISTSAPNQDNTLDDITEPETANENELQIALVENAKEQDDTQDTIPDYYIDCNGTCGTRIKKWTEPFYLCLICPNTDLCEECHTKRLAWNKLSANMAPSVGTPETPPKHDPKNTSEGQGEGSSEGSSEKPSEEPTKGTSVTLPVNASEKTTEEPVSLSSDTSIEMPWNTFCGENHHYIKGPMKDWKGIKMGVIQIGEQKLEVKEWRRQMKEERWSKAWERYWLRQGGLKDIDVE
jgi:hypothetical protein